MPGPAFASEQGVGWANTEKLKLPRQNRGEFQDGARIVIEERRLEPRKDLLKMGKVLVDGSAPMLCLTLNVSTAGAKIDVEAPDALPDRFVLIASDFDAPRPCRVLWRIGRRMGVRFTG